MFHCPENDIHSIYLDGELPQNFVKDYEAHLASCPKCAAKLEKLKKIRAALLLPSRINGASGAQGVDESVLAVSSIKAQKPIADEAIVVNGGIQQVSFDKNAESSLAIKASDFESLKSESEAAPDGMAISVTKLSNLNSISASNVSNVASARLDVWDILK